MRIPFLDLTSQTQTVLDEFLCNVRALAQQNQFVGGQPIREFEERFAGYCGVPHCVAVNSGTDGLCLALVGTGMGSDDEVITSPFTFAGTTEAISRVGKLVLADIDADTFTLSPRAVEEKITERTRVLLPVHIFGLPAPMEDFSGLSQRYRLAVVEDACQAHGASIGTQKVGSFGQSASFSFYPSKTLGAFGDGGAVTSHSESIAARIRRLRNHGEASRYEHLEEGYNSRMDTLQAAVLNLKLRFIDEWVERRRLLASLYRQQLDDVEAVRFQKQPDRYQHSYYLVAARVEQRSRLVEYLTKLEIETRIVYPTPLHLLAAYRHLNHRRGDFPNAEEVCEQVLCFPAYPGMEETQVLEIARAIRKFYVG